MALLERVEQIGQQDYQAIAASLSQELKASAVERDLRAGIPEEEIQRLRETGLLPLVVPQIYGGGEIMF